MKNSSRRGKQPQPQSSTQEWPSPNQKTDNLVCADLEKEPEKEKERDMQESVYMS